MAAKLESLYAFAWYRSGRRAERAEEVVQETWLTAVRRIAAFDPERGPFESWLKGIAANVLKNQRRRWRRDERTENLHDENLLDEPPPSENGELVGLALTALPQRYQLVLRAKYEERLSVGEIAQRLGATAKATECHRIQFLFGEGGEPSMPVTVNLHEVTLRAGLKRSPI